MTRSVFLKLNFYKISSRKWMAFSLLTVTKRLKDKIIKEECEKKRIENEENWFANHLNRKEKNWQKGRGEKKDRWIERANSRPTNIRPALAFEEDVEDILRSVSHVTWTAWRKTRTSIGMWKTGKCKDFVLTKESKNIWL